MPAFFLILLVLALCATTVAGGWVAWMLDQSRRSVVTATQRPRRRWWARFVRRAA